MYDKVTEELLASERRAVKELMESILADEGRLDNPFILGEAAKELYEHAKLIYGLKSEAES